MLTARVAGGDYEFDSRQVERAVAGVDPEPINEHYVVIAGRRFPPKQVLAEVTGVDRADFTTHQARSVLRRLGFGAYRVGAAPPLARRPGVGPHDGSEAALLGQYRGRWVAQDGLTVLFDAPDPGEVVRWLRRHRRRARVWQVPADASAAGSTSSTP